MARYSYRISSTSLSADGKLLAAATEDNSIRLWDTLSGKLIRTLKGHSGDITTVTFSPDVRVVASGSRDTTIKLWDVKSGKCIKTIKPYLNSINSISFSPDGKIIASVSNSELEPVKLLDVSSEKLIKAFEGRSENYLISFSPDGTKLAALDRYQTITLWDVVSGKILRTFTEHNDKIRFFSISPSSFSFSPDGKKIISGSNDGFIKLWDIESGNLVYKLKEKENGFWVNSLSFSPDGKIIAAGRNALELWDTYSGTLITTINGHFDQINSIHFSPDGKKIYAASEDTQIKIWDINIGV